MTSKRMSTLFIVKFRAPKISLQLTTIGEAGFFFSLPRFL